MRICDRLKKHRGKIVVLLLLAVAAAWYFLTHQEDFTRERLMDFGRNLPVVWFLVAMLLVPVVGGPLTVFLVLAGVRFGFYGGMGVTAGAVFFHHLLVFRLSHGGLRGRVEHWLERRGWKIPSFPPENRKWFTVLFASVHGPPYALKLYLLALTDLPFRIYLWVGAPVYIAFCALPVGAGSAVMSFNTTWISVILGGFAAVWLLGYFIRRHFKGKAVIPDGK